ncbi:MAG: HEAT repeat domain-containing protein [Anaerolineales bacterium]|nr:HEAT repeat domain-containing protein [Anaerolineales bacterium]
MRFRLPNIDTFSFWLGVVLTTIVWLVITAFRPALRHIQNDLREKQSEAKERRSRLPSAVERHYRQAVLLRAQGMHLAAPLFALDEIVDSPVLLAPPPRVEPGTAPPLEDIVGQTVPYLPAWPELAATYKASTLTLSEALSGDSDIVLTGHTGTGKTVTLAYLASRLVRRDPVAGLSDDILPFLIHAADLNLAARKVDDPLKPLVDTISEYAPVLDLGRIPDFIKQAFAEQRALLLIDGTDELAPTGLQQVVEFIKSIKKSYPQTRVVTTASPEYLDGLVSLNFTPLMMAAWDDTRRARLLEKWADLWARYVALEAWAQTGPEAVDPILLNHWLDRDARFFTPLEFTLKVWSVYAGDVRGPRPVDAIEAHLRRLTPANAPIEAMEMLALQVNLATEPVFDPRKAHDWIKAFEPAATAPESAVGGENDVILPENEGGERPEKEWRAGRKEKGKRAGKQQAQAPSLGLISAMVGSGLLTQHRGNRMRFTQPLFGGYLAGKALVNYKAEAVLEQPPWVGKHLALHYLSIHGDISGIVTKLLGELDRPLSRNLLLAARWLREAPPQAAWRGQVMARLVELLQTEGQPLSLRGQALAAFVLSNDSSIGVLFRQFYEAPSAELIQLAALGSGAIRDTKAIDGLSRLANNPSPNIRRAACLALVSIGTTDALESIGYLLLHGDEDQRQCAAEALANDPDEGYAMLIDAAAMQGDIMVRRAAVYGLARVNEPWTDEILTRMQTEDPEWVVRNSAVEIVEARQGINPHIPRRLPHPSESAWVIAFAGKQGLGVTPNELPTDLLLQALKSGSEEEKLASLSYLRILPHEGVFGTLYQAMYAGEATLREAIFQTVWEMAARGIEIPDPVQFGVGY